MLVLAYSISPYLICYTVHNRHYNVFFILYSPDVILYRKNRSVLKMEIDLVIAKNLKAIRESKKLSLEKVAELTGVSKTMIGQIERGESAPTITTIWKIANGLKVSFTSLI